MNVRFEIETAQRQKILKERILGHVELEEKKFHSLLAILYERVYRRKSSLLRAGETWDRLFYIHRGLVRFFYLDSDGREFNKAFFAEGHIIWPVAPQDRRCGILFNIAAVEDTIVLECPFAELHQLLCHAGQWEKFALPFAETLVEQKFQREHDFLLLSATERLARLAKAYPNIISRLPDYHLASFLGITSVSLSRIRRLTYDNENSSPVN